MGNCLRHESETHWAGEDWDDFITEDEEDHHHHHSSKTSIIKDKTVIVRGDSIKSSDPSHHEFIKIRLTKKQLQDLLSKVNVDHQQAFSCPSLVNNFEESNQQRSWRPVLQSIPEIN